ncbi:hypothetical protein A2313_00125 [Candidatus Roizmanbacteria bacterium RIFOXYB2_FULL_41_10]|uniref:Uncharacterized protein n=1 Tax=Candidatus Roizmanbacteria bacterium RIFOXYA1_FULL_41_12 TaxID=1802082 RepID=A0A1F7KAP5_9BACT|nr:MAG: hypothetical protein A2209_04595 [Candidatus Roizmanbacteria bacterium RIFOXYA1_FULL_41_12]OGK66795.1 MAG: hypothetical protein A2377_02730 [Candidatus Roizmanbacteria bacterium RIFOXYB1_FULL_41_27]OGK70831.1 MAG: hypothetical protein A2403_01975 [Candidatus Roizmanbacteria bacterium RIFOXYC1_FULL_41_16]OGK71378.1 MAG: hypothetical protein A2313_00125 [Candidatus Roizmanbacteria bacterium RIFOXYB2_FULL_41_10]OGK74521.1 MAG: hypothetical protein A2459_02520 [Candidatus Roizmanbacteria ba
MKDRLISRNRLINTLCIFLSLAALGLGAACSHAEPVALSTFTPVPTTEPTSTPTNFERNCKEIPEATRIVAIGTILASIYAEHITPNQVITCLPIVGIVNQQGAIFINPEDLLNHRIDGRIPTGTIICYGTNQEAVLAECSSITP